MVVIDYKNVISVIDKLPLTITELGFVKKIFPDATSYACSTFEEMFELVRLGKADAAMVPLQNLIKVKTAVKI